MSFLAKVSTTCRRQVKSLENELHKIETIAFSFDFHVRRAAADLPVHFAFHFVFSPFRFVKEPHHAITISDYLECIRIHSAGTHFTHFSIAANHTDACIARCLCPAYESWMSECNGNVFVAVEMNIHFTYSVPVRTDKEQRIRNEKEKHKQQINSEHRKCILASCNCDTRSCPCAHTEYAYGNLNNLVLSAATSSVHANIFISISFFHSRICRSRCALGNVWRWIVHAKQLFYLDESRN